MLIPQEGIHICYVNLVKRPCLEGHTGEDTAFVLNGHETHIKMSFK